MSSTRQHRHVPEKVRHDRNSNKPLAGRGNAPRLLWPIELPPSVLHRGRVVRVVFTHLTLVFLITHKVVGEALSRLPICWASITHDGRRGYIGCTKHAWRKKAKKARAP